VVSILAVAGGGALGGLLVGWITQIGARSLTTRPMPRGPLNIVRLLGAIAAGWLVALLLLPALGPGLGPGKGPGPGGDGTEPSGKEHPGPTGREDTPRDSTPRDTSKTSSTDGWTLLITVTQSVPVEYEVHYPTGMRKYSFAELKKLESDLETEMNKEKHPLIHVKIDSPSDPNASGVKPLRDWVTAHHLD